MNRQTDRLWQRLLYHLLGHQATNEVGKRRTGLFCPTEVDPIISLRPLWCNLFILFHWSCSLGTPYSRQTAYLSAHRMIADNWYVIVSSVKSSLRYDVLDPAGSHFLFSLSPKPNVTTVALNCQNMVNATEGNTIIQSKNHPMMERIHIRLGEQSFKHADVLSEKN